MNRVAMVAEIGLTAGTPFTKADLSTAASEHQICQQSRPMLSPLYGIISLGDQIATWWQVNNFGPLAS